MKVVRVGTCPCCAALSVPLAVVAAHVAPIVAFSRLSLPRVVERRPSRWPVFAPHLGSAVLLVLSGTKVLRLDLSLFLLRPMVSVSLVVP